MNRSLLHLIGQPAVNRLAAGTGVAVEADLFAAEGFRMYELGMGDIEQVVVQQSIVGAHRFEHAAAATHPWLPVDQRKVLGNGALVG
ncbi:hypothetical protein D9M71_719970 [compost metagenome]